MSAGASPNSGFDSELNALIREQFNLLSEDTRSAAAAIKKYQDEAGARISEYQQRMFKKDPKADAPLAVQISLQFIEQKLLAMPALAPYVVMFIQEKIKAVGEATKNALGPLPELNPEQLAELQRAAGIVPPPQPPPQPGTMPTA